MLPKLTINNHNSGINSSCILLFFVFRTKMYSDLCHKLNYFYNYRKYTLKLLTSQQKAGIVAFIQT